MILGDDIPAYADNHMCRFHVQMYRGHGRAPMRFVHPTRQQGRYLSAQPSSDFCFCESEYKVFARLFGTMRS